MQWGAVLGIGALGAGLAGGTFLPALAQAPARELPGAVEPGRDRPLPQAPTQPSFDFTIEAPNRSQIPRSVQELHFVLSDIRIEGAHVLPPESFRPLYAKLIGKTVTVSDILDVADAIEDQYRRKGYILSHAFVPVQRVKNGIFTIDVIEGYVASVSVDGGDPAAQGVVRSYLQPVLAARPLDLATMERALLLANDLPGVVAAGVLRPSPNVPGASDLAVSLIEHKIAGGLEMDNRGSQFSGIWTLGGDIEGNGLLTAGDQLGVNYESSPDALEKTSGGVQYRRPVGPSGMVASFNVNASYGVPGSTLQQFNLVTDSLAVGPRLSYPILRSRAESLQIDGGFTVQEAKVTAVGLPVSHDQWRVADLGLTYSRVALGGTWSASLDGAEGLGLFGATPDGSPNLSHPGADTEFTKITGTVRHTRQLIGPLSVAISAQGQYAFAPLVAGEQITFGGTQIGRGYDPAAITGDDGAGGSVELRYDTHFSALHLDTVQPYVYYDTGKVWNFRPNLAGSVQSVASTGVGVRVFLPYNISGDVELSRTLIAVPGSDAGGRGYRVLMDAAVRY